MSGGQSPVALHLVVRSCPQRKGAFPNRHKCTKKKWATGGPNEQNFSDEIVKHTEHYATLKAKTNTNLQSKKKQTKKQHM